MLSDIENVRKLTELLGDEGFVDALTNAEELVNDVDETLERVEQIEGDAEQAVREANDALNAVDYRLQKFDEAIRLIEAKIEAGFSVGFFLFAYQQLTAGAVFLAAGLFVMGLLGASSLAVTIVTMPQVQRLRQAALYLLGRIDEDDPGGEVADEVSDRVLGPDSWLDDQKFDGVTAEEDSGVTAEEDDRAEESNDRAGRTVTGDQSGPRIDWKTEDTAGESKHRTRAEDNRENRSGRRRS